MNLITTQIKGIDLIFKTDQKLFSPRRIDSGTLALISQINFRAEDKVLDLGCGCGVVGILAAKIIGEERVTMVDIDETAINYSRKNAILNHVPKITLHWSNGVQNVNEIGFTKIICHPPYHADFSVPKHFIERGFNKLAINGSIFLVTKRKEWYKNKLISIFGGVKITEIDDYIIFEARKMSEQYAKGKPRKGNKKSQSANYIQ